MLMIFYEANRNQGKKRNDQFMLKWSTKKHRVRSFYEKLKIYFTKTNILIFLVDHRFLLL